MGTRPGRRLSSIVSGARPNNNIPTLTWRGPDNDVRHCDATSNALSVPFHRAAQARSEASRVGQGNRPGFYWCGQTGEMLRHESLAELTGLFWLDHTQPIEGIAIRPMCVTWRDGLEHYPAVYILTRDGGGRVCDIVNPLAPIDPETSRRMEHMCRQIGWQYLLVTPLTDTTRNGLEFIANYRRPALAPDHTTEIALFDFIGHGKRSVGECANFLDSQRPPRRVHELYHLMWTRQVAFDIRRPLTPQTPLTKGPGRE
ncbi:MAG: TnsA-like heteromeric transposase endonuclease subunit [Actinobacteria bacterium]|nr:TnsA-like heteromeric transposase endonuclease subunit [Actinomycetota bacterium]